MRPLSYALAAPGVDDGDRDRQRGSRRAPSSPAAPPRSTSSGWASSAPDLLVDINDLPLAAVEDAPRRRPADRRAGPDERRRARRRSWPGATRRSPQALLLGASAQLRNMASMGGNLCQRDALRLLPRRRSRRATSASPGSGCSALEGLNRGHAILGTSEHCIATHPSDVAVALVAFDAVVHTTGPGGARAIPIDDFFLLPGDIPDVEHPLEHGELIVAIEVPPLAARAALACTSSSATAQSYEFALVSVAAALRRAATASSRGVRLALGGVGTKPWRAGAPRRALIGEPATRRVVRRRGGRRAGAATVREHNAFKVPLAERAIVRALNRAMARDERRRSASPSTASTAARRSPAAPATRRRSRSPAWRTPRSSARPSRAAG